MNTLLNVCDLLLTLHEVSSFINSINPAPSDVSLFLYFEFIMVHVDTNLTAGVR